MTSSSSLSSSERRRRRKLIKSGKILEGGGDSESSDADFSDDDGRRTVENNHYDGGNEATEFTIYDNRHHEEYYHDIGDDASYGTNHSLRMSLAARRKKLASMNSVGSLTDGGSIEGGSLREVRRKRRDRSGSLQSLDGSLLGGSWRDIFNASWTGSLVKKKKKKSKDKKKEKKKKKKNEKKKSPKEKKANSIEKKPSGERRHKSKDEEYDRKKRIKSKKEILSGKDGKERVYVSKGKELRRSTNKQEEKKALKKSRDDSSSSDSSLSSDFDASTMGSTIDLPSKKTFIYVDQNNGKDEKANRIPGGGERRRITVDGSEYELSQTRRIHSSSHRRISDGALINGIERRRALKTSSDSKLGGVKVSSVGSSTTGANNSIYYACDEDTGTCIFHPEIQLRKRSRLGGWKDVLRQCPKCIQAGGTPVSHDNRDSRRVVHKRREVSDPRMAYSGVARGDDRIDRGRDKGRDDDRLRSASNSLTRRRIPPDRTMNHGDLVGPVKKTQSNRRADLIRQHHIASVQQNHRKDHHYRQQSFDSVYSKKHVDNRRLDSHDIGKDKKHPHEAAKTRSQSGRDAQGLGSSSRNAKESHSTLKRQTSDKSKQFNYSAPVLDSQTKNSQLLEDAIARERRRASTGEGPTSKLKPTKESAPCSSKTQPMRSSQQEYLSDVNLTGENQQQKSRSIQGMSIEREESNHDACFSKGDHGHVEDRFSLLGLEKSRFQDSTKPKYSKEELKQFTVRLNPIGARANSFSEEYTERGSGVEKISVSRHAKSFDHILCPSRHTRSTENANKMSSVDEECEIFESKQKRNTSPSKQTQIRSTDGDIDTSPNPNPLNDTKNVTSSFSGLDSPPIPKPKTVVTNLEWSVKGFSGLYSGEVNKKFEPHGEGELALDDGIVIRMKWINGYPVKDEENEKVKDSDLPNNNGSANSCNHIGQDIQVEELDVHLEEKIDHMKEQSVRDTHASLEHGDQEGARGEDIIPCYCIGDEGRRRDMMKDNDKDVALMRIASLQPKDNAFIRRTDGSWSYAEVKKITPDTIVFFASSKGATKAYIRKYWVSHIRVPKTEILLASKSRGNDDGSKESNPVREESHQLNRFSVANVKAKVDEEISDGRPTSILRKGRSFAERNSDQDVRRRRRRSVSFSPLRNEYEISSQTGETDDDEDDDCVSYQRFVTIDDSLVGSGYDLRGVEPL